MYIYEDLYNSTMCPSLSLCVCCLSCTDPSMSGGHSYTHEMLEHENDQLVNTLSDKVSALKSVSINYKLMHVHYE